MTPPIPARRVRVTVQAKDAFFRRHRKDAVRAREAWASLVDKQDALLSDIDFGPWFKPPKLPAFLRDVGALHVVKGLPHGFRAVYAVIKDPKDGLVVQVEWLGDHKEYDALFGYATS